MKNEDILSETVAISLKLIDKQFDTAANLREDYENRMAKTLSVAVDYIERKIEKVQEDLDAKINFLAESDLSREDLENKINDISKAQEHLNSLILSVQIIKGDKGDDGVPGKDGADGKDGVAGTNGVDGTNGTDGIDGKDGAQGIQGIPGIDGKDGSEGIQGIQGIQGIPGKDGKDGVDGIQGIPGKDGKDGKDGVDGIQGIPGKNGIRGIQGIPGKDGTDGKNGKNGKNGKDGKDGKDGIDGKDGDVKEVEDKFTILSNNLETYLNKRLSTIAFASGGGGSAKMLDNDDVVFSRPGQLANNDILIFDDSLQKFKALNIVDIINDITASVEMQYNKLIDVAGDYTYIGEADPGSSSASAVWRIKRVYTNPSTQDMTILWADGVATFIKVWDDRLTYTYS